MMGRLKSGNTILRHNDVHAGRETVADDHAAHSMNEVDSGDGTVDDISNHGGTSRPARSEIGGGCRNSAMPCDRVPPGQRTPF